MGPKKNDAAGDVVTVRERRFGKRQKLIGLAILLVVIGVVSLLGVHMHEASVKNKNGQNSQNGQNGPNGSGSGSSSGSSALTPEQQRYQALQQKTQALDGSGKYAEEAQVIEAFLKTNPPKDQATAQLFTLGGAYMNAKEYQKAADSFNKLPAIDQKFAVDSYHGQALAYEKLGNNTAAIDLYKKAIANMRASDPEKYNSLIAIDQASISNLGGTP